MGPRAEPAAVERERQAIVIVGPRRSGTSALAKALSLLGWRLPMNLVSPGPGNEDRHFEPEPVMRFDELCCGALSVGHRVSRCASRNDMARASTCVHNTRARRCRSARSGRSALSHSCTSAAILRVASDSPRWRRRSGFMA